MVRRLAIVVALLLAPALCPSASSAVAPDPPRVVLGSGFVARPCPDDFVVPKGVDAECGFIRVPQDRSRPRGRMIKVAAAVVHSTAAQVAAEPILVLPGGPSAGSISDFYYPYYFKHAAWAKDHDLVFVDTRGTGTSSPRLGCPEVDRAEVDFFYAKPYVGSAAHRIIGGALVSAASAWCGAVSTRRRTRRAPALPTSRPCAPPWG